MEATSSALTMTSTYRTTWWCNQERRVKIFCCGLLFFGCRQ